MVDLHPWTILRTEIVMQIDKNTVLEMLRSRGQHDQAQQADGELPDQVDADEHANLLQKFGVNPAELLGGGKGPGGTLGN
jgi:hypothetical protein